MSDNINSPSHYTQGEIECIDAIKASMPSSDFYGYLKGNVINYLWRVNLKGDRIENIQKAQWYLNRMVMEGNIKRIKGDKEDAVWHTCPQCSARVTTRLTICPECQYDFTND